MERLSEGLDGDGRQRQRRRRVLESSTAWESLAKGGMGSSISDASWHVYHPSCCGEALCALASPRGYMFLSEVVQVLDKLMLVH